MSQDLYELLQAAKADAPPMRHTVDDIVADGRRRRGRRRVGWAGGTSAVLVAVVAASVAVPQLVSRPTHGAAGPAAPASSTAASPTAAAFRYPDALFAYGFRGYTVGHFEVSTPILVTPGYQEAYVRKDGEVLNLYGDNGTKKGIVVATAPGYSGMLTVYRPGVFQPTRFLKAEKIQVHGRPGYYGADITYRDSSNEPHPRPALAWQYADNAWAVVSNLTPTVYSKADLIQVAEGLTGSVAYPATVAFKASWVPSGYVLTSAGGSDDYPNGGPEMVSSVRLVRTRPSYRDLTQTVDASQAGTPTIRIALYPKAWADATHLKPGVPAYCNPGNRDLCFRMTPDGNYLAEVFSSGGLSQTELRRILDNLTFAAVDNPSAWYPVTEAVPAG
jgi:hypothetical protein